GCGRHQRLSTDWMRMFPRKNERLLDGAGLALVLVVSGRTALAIGLFSACALLSCPDRALAQDDRTDGRPEGGPASPPVKPASPPGLFEEPSFISSIQIVFDGLADAGRPSQGFYLEVSNMITGSGFVSLGPGYRHRVFNNRAFIDTSAAAS